MNILFDIFVLLPEMTNEVSVEDRAIFNEIVDYFEERLAPLKSEMDKVETLESCCVMIHFLPPQEEWTLQDIQRNEQIRISINGYSAPLRNKIDSSFNDNDFILLNQKLDAIAGSFLN